MKRLPLVAVLFAAGLAGQDPPEVETAEVLQGPWPAALRLSSKIEAIDVVRLRPTLDGQVVQVMAGIGDQVRAGDLLVEIDAPDRRAAVAGLRAELDRAKIEIELAGLRAAMAELEVQGAELNLRGVRLEQAEVKQRLELALKNMERVEALHQAGSIGPGSLDQARLEVTEMQGQGRAFAHRVERAELELESSRRAFEVVRLERRSAEAAAAAAEAELFAAEAALDACSIKAPMDGVVLMRGVAPGDVVRAFETELLELVDLDRVRVRIMVPRREIEQVSLGSKVWIRRDPYSIEAEESAITQLAMVVEKDEKGALWREATVEFRNADRRWLLGDECSVWVFPAQDGKASVIVPESAVVEIGGAAYVYLVAARKGQEAVARRRVILGRRDAGDVEILSGINDNKYPVVVSPPEGLADRSQVVIK